MAPVALEAELAGIDQAASSKVLLSEEVSVFRLQLFLGAQAPQLRPLSNDALVARPGRSPWCRAGKAPWGTLSVVVAGPGFPLSHWGTLGLALSLQLGGWPGAHSGCSPSVSGLLVQ